MAPLEVYVADISFQCTCHTPYLVLGAPQPELCHVGKYAGGSSITSSNGFVCVCERKKIAITLQRMNV